MDTTHSPDERAFAQYVATKLNDMDSLDYHLQNAARFTESFQRKVLEQVLSVPEHKIKKSRAALYTYLISKHGRGTNTRY
jgi:hypothetical protein